MKTSGWRTWSRGALAALMMVACRRGESAAAVADAQAAGAVVAAPAPVTRLQADGVAALVTPTERVRVCAPTGGAGSWVRVKIEAVGTPPASQLKLYRSTPTGEESMQAGPESVPASLTAMIPGCADIEVFGPDRAPVRLRATLATPPNDVGRLVVAGGYHQRTVGQVPIRPGAPSVVSLNVSSPGDYEISFPDSYDVPFMIYREGSSSVFTGMTRGGMGSRVSLSPSSRLLINLDTPESRVVMVTIVGG
ncbi:MAG: hypothetical protein EPO40_03240 [Myxococcaceae bacterium]|nr:MAG: hypothetical protein EPO40_03240 [Myxococcaceae bacterium]